LGLVAFRTENKLDQFGVAGVKKRVFRHAFILHASAIDSKPNTIQKKAKCLLAELLLIG
jgi:hypothetical protein